MPTVRAALPARRALGRVAAVLAVLIVGPLLIAAAPGTTASSTTAPGSDAASSTAAGVRSFFVPVTESSGGSSRIRLDVDLYTPAVTPAPAVLLAHGFGQTKTDLAGQAKRLQASGYVVLAYTARGFGRSGGAIGLDSLDGEVPDARALVDVLARSPAVRKAGGDPVVGAVGGSYGGALALMLGATDPRVDTVVAAITWNDLAEALVPSSTGRVAGSTTPPARDFKSGWTSRLFGAGITAASDPCGRFTQRFCALYRGLVTGETLSAADLALLRRSSPSTVLAGLHAPTLLLQGLQDSLFGLDQSDANARAIARAGAPVQVRWFDGGHDGGGTGGTDAVITAWLAAHLRARQPVPADFRYAVPPSATGFGQTVTAARYPGLAGSGPVVRIPLAPPAGPAGAVTVVNPPGGRPASVTGVPGLGTGSAVGRAASGLLARANPPAEQARFVSRPLTSPVVLAGSATVRLRIERVPGSVSPTNALLYGQLSVRTGDADRVLPGGVAPIRVPLPADGATITATLPGTAWSFSPGDLVTLTLRTSDSQFQGSTTPAAYRVSLDGPIALPTVTPIATDRSAGRPSSGVLIGIGATLLAALLLIVVALGRSRRGSRRWAAAPSPVPTAVTAERAERAEERKAEAKVTAEREAAAVPGQGQQGLGQGQQGLGQGQQGLGQAEGPPLQIRGLTKRFRSGFLAVDDVSFTVERGQVLGLLGENGAGKTTTLRMVAGLIRPDSGTATAFGATIVPGSPVLARLGCFIEGPGFLPHLSGRRNLELYWATTGRPGREARFDEALAVADLGGALAKRVRGYSQGMRQRLAIAQAMLGMPDLLVLDEPTNGLDPPQITALRGVLRRYAEGGRTVIVSSHLLGEVERTCSHVVVMSHGRVVATGEVGEVAGDATELVVGVTDVEAALTAVRALGVQRAEAHEPDGIRVAPGEHPVQAVVAALVSAGVGVTDLQRGRHLEEAFLDLIGAAEPSA